MSTSAMGMYSYGGSPPGRDRVRPDGTVVGKVFYDPMPEPAYVDSGIRSSFAGSGVFDGALTVPARDLPLRERSRQVRTQLRGARPYGGTPTAAALDDLYFFFDQDEMGRQIARERRRHIVLITDGPPDPDYRELAGSTPSERLIFPYPKAPEAARHLHCGYDTTGCNGLVDAVHVVAFDVHDQDTLDELDQIAAEGGSERARRANDAAELRRELDAIFAAVHAP
ncbi:MAG TPA: vWA domain-containing protein [Polyangiales bacterium]|nr:vWA domain-containing protein [Polyangiales bacterium]